ncbi:MAG: Maf family protein [Halothiobacillaceae bacterium]|jgi:septum formation protein|nr:Maf family protein [Halothiobacillaceae bacterium]MDY0049995.1 Maf family protein [Halothiobacillaceae bacterium]
MLLLASTSPRRAELLRQIGVDFRPLAVAVDESVLSGESPEAHVRRLALAKAREGAQLARTGDVALGADTVLSLDGNIIGKPADFSAYAETMRRLSARTHEVFSAVALADAGGRAAVELCVTRVRFSALDEASIAAYWASGEPVDKAGGYAIQGRAALFIERIEGSYSGVMGLPLYETGRLLRAFQLLPHGIAP